MINQNSGLLVKFFKLPKLSILRCQKHEIAPGMEDALDVKGFKYPVISVKDKNSIEIKLVMRIFV